MFLVIFCMKAANMHLRHDQIQRLVNVTDVKFSKRHMKSERMPIRIKFDSTFLDPDSIDNEMCRFVGEVVQFYGNNVVCAESDIPTPEKIEVVQKTFQNIESFLNRLLKVDPLPGSFDLTKNDPSIPVSQNSSGDVDLYITLYSRPYGNSGIAAAASYIKRDGNTYRPIQGFINLNFLRVPKTIQSYETKEDRSFFEICLHELTHILGFSVNGFIDWIDPKTGKSYGKDNLPATTLTFPEYPNKNFYILHTPKLHEFAKNRFGIENFTATCPSGIELEDGGSFQTALSHLEQRVYYTELLSGATMGYSRISNATLSALDDTGWYDVDYSFAEPLEWGDYRARLGEDGPYKNFPLGKPALNYPQGYIMTPKEYNITGCTFDHRAGGLSFAFPNYCEQNRDKDYCQSIKFYDANNTGYHGLHDLADYSIIRTPYSNQICRNTDYMSLYNEEKGMFFGENSFCAMTTLRSGCEMKEQETTGCYRMQCDDDNQLSIIVKNVAKKCPVKGYRLGFKKFVGEIKCPDPKIICGSLNYKKNLNRPNYKYTVAPYAPENPQKDQVKCHGLLSTNGIISIVVSVTALAFSILLLVFIIFRTKPKRQNKKRKLEEQPEKVTTDVEPDQIVAHLVDEV